jgi:hypothetical protein
VSVDDVVALAGEGEVVAPAPFKVVETGRSAEDVVALVPGDRVDLGPAEEPVISRPALEEAVPKPSSRRSRSEPPVSWSLPRSP